MILTIGLSIISVYSRFASEGIRHKDIFRMKGAPGVCRLILKVTSIVHLSLYALLIFAGGRLINTRLGTEFLLVLGHTLGDFFFPER